MTVNVQYPFCYRQISLRRPFFLTFPGTILTRHSYSLARFIGQRVTIKFTGKETLAGHDTSFFDDDNAVNVS